MWLGCCGKLQLERASEQGRQTTGQEELASQTSSGRQSCGTSDKLSGLGLTCRLNV